MSTPFSRSLLRVPPIDAFGVGTKLATCDPQPSLGGVYKLTARRQSADEPWTPVIKLSEMAYKRTVPGIQHIRRFYDANGCPAGDMIFDPDYLVTKNPESKATVVDIIDPYSTHKLEGTSREPDGKAGRRRQACRGERVY